MSSLFTHTENLLLHVTSARPDTVGYTTSYSKSTLVQLIIAYILIALSFSNQELSTLSEAAAFNQWINVSTLHG